jgi:hypothetical protein
MCTFNKILNTWRKTVYLRTKQCILQLCSHFLSVATMLLRSITLINNLLTKEGFRCWENMRKLKPNSYKYLSSKGILSLVFQVINSNFPHGLLPTNPRLPLVEWVLFSWNNLRELYQTLFKGDSTQKRTSISLKTVPRERILSTIQHSLHWFNRKI